MLQPQYGCKRRADRLTYGHVAGQLARVLGHPLDATQQHICDVALEVVDGRLAYSRVIIALPRRAGKSFLIFLLMLTRAYLGLGRQRVWYTAQNGQNVTKLWRQEWAPLLEASPHLAAEWTFRASQGHEEFLNRARSCFVSAFAPKRDALHSQSGDMVVFDEAWAHSLALGDELEQAAGPLLATRPDGQRYYLSAAGDIDSTWWAELLSEGRTAAQLDMGYGLAHFEFTADGFDYDETDPETWRLVHPAYHHGRITTEFLAGEYQRDPQRFRRQYLNITDRTSVGREAPLQLDRWHALALDHAPPLPEGGNPAVTFGVDCDPDQESTSIVACTIVDGLPTLELVEHRPGWLWCVDRLTELVDRYWSPAVGIDVAGQSPAAPLFGPLKRAGVPLFTPNLAGVTAAAARLSADVAGGLIRQVPHPVFDAAVGAAKRRPIGDGAWSFGRADSDDPVSPVVAAMFATACHPQYDGRVAEVI